MKKQYEYNVGGVAVGTREAARMVQRSFRALAEQTLTTNGNTPVIPRIVQKLTVQRVVR
jgi:hypothetical protein